MSEKKRKKGVLGGHVYVVQPCEGYHLVYKVPNDNEAKENPYRVEDGLCNCKAGDFGNECKHVGMVKGTLVGEELPRKAAEAQFEDYLDKIREEMPGSKLVSLLPCKPVSERSLTLATGMGCGTISEQGPSDRMTIWSEFGSLLLRIHCFKDETEFKEQLHRVRTKARDTQRGPRESTPERAGKTYGPKPEESDVPV